MTIVAALLVGACAVVTIAALIRTGAASDAVDLARAQLRRTARYYDEGARYVEGRKLFSEVAAIAKSALNLALRKP